ncbi:unnamed protein product [Enterobius vermicularis]|uniref:ShKT domain-containing protein n=1 Tax=Enterobius vermicularis TaxID=51028 RepID=A0A0N4VC72_ENTVE|nr:unnamed protein product [Enterobius vermicularis]
MSSNLARHTVWIAVSVTECFHELPFQSFLIKLRFKTGASGESSAAQPNAFRDATEESTQRNTEASAENTQLYLCCFLRRISNTVCCSSLVVTISKTSSGDCNDVLQTCVTAKSYCYDLAYLNLMKQQCRKTCKFCPETCNDTNTKCANSLSYCHDPFYGDLMGNTWRRSCKFCGGTSEDELTNCAQNKQLCFNLAYKKLMNIKCLKTCRVC